VIRTQPEPLAPNPTPLIIAHRGASEQRAEHTLPAYLAAIDSGADGLECDVRLTRDGHLVCVHDRTVNRTSNGRGIVSELDLQRLRDLDFGAWHDPLPASADELLGEGYLAGVAPDRISRDNAEVLTLNTLLEVVAECPRPLRLLIETKHPTRYSGLVEKELVRMLQRFGWAGAAAPVTVMSFALLALRRVKLLAPDLPLVLLLEHRLPLRRDGSLPTGVSIAGPGIHLVRSNPDYVRRVHRAGNRVYCWTVDEPSDVALALRLGVDAIITNRPETVRREVQRIGRG
jgi:glycerophosphoryl diester phosphodiesterase